MASRRPTTPRGGAPRRAANGASSRPAPAARPRTTSAQVAVVPRGLSRRAAVLAGLLLVVGIALAPFLRDAVNQQAELAALERDVVQREQRVDELSRQLERWDDPAFVKAQARQRLKYVMPGEVGYIVLDERPAEEAGADPSSEAAGEVAGSTRPWFGSLWQSVQQAGEPESTAPAAPAEDPGAPKPAPSP
jgi:cell division protein FtsB